jgi:hypothetical protein
MTLDQIIFCAKLSFYNLIILLNVIDIIFGAILIAQEENSCYSYYANTIYTIIISLIVIIGLFVIMYLVVKIKNFNNYTIIYDMILFGIFVINFVYELIVISLDCNNINYKKYLISNVIYNSLGIITYVVYALYNLKSRKKDDTPIQRLENPVMMEQHNIIQISDMKNSESDDDKSYEIM